MDHFENQAESFCESYMTDPPPSLGRRVPSLSQLHNLEDMVGSSLASAIDTLTLDADSTENGVANALGRNVSTAPPNSAPATETAYGTWQTLLKFAQDLESRALILLNVESVLVEGACVYGGWSPTRLNPPPRALRSLL